MRKILLVFVVLIAYAASAQVISGTIIVFNFTKDKVVIAADSLAQNHETGVPDYSHCKIATFSHQLVFASVGNTSYVNHGLILWDNINLAQDATHAAPKREGSTIDEQSAIAYWAMAVKNHWDRLDKAQVASIAAKTNGQLTGGIFIGKELIPRVAVIVFNQANVFDPIEIKIGSDVAPCWPCAEEQGGHICVAGSHQDVAAKFCSEIKPNSLVKVRTELLSSTRNTRLPVKIVEDTIDAYEKTAGDVGGAVDVVTIGKDGTITWNSRKTNCPEDQ